MLRYFAAILIQNDSQILKKGIVVTKKYVISLKILQRIYYLIFTLATKNGHILRYTWEGQEKRDYSLDLKRIPFCTDQQVLKAVPLSDKGVYVSKIAYSPLIGGYAVVFNDGRAAFLFSSTVNFDPNVSYS